MDSDRPMDPDDIREFFPDYKPADLGSVDALLEHARQIKAKRERERHEQEELRKRRNEGAREHIATEVIALHEQQVRLDQAISELEDLGTAENDLSPLYEKRKELASQLASRTEMIGYDPIRAQARESRSQGLYARLLPKVERSSTVNEMLSVLNELEQALPRLKPEAAASLLRHVELHELADACADAITAIRRQQVQLEDPALQDRREEIEQIVDKIRELDDETEFGTEHVGYLSQDELLNQICIWSGKARLLQENKELLPKAAVRRLERIFGRLTTISREKQPGYCEALDRAKDLDWAEYVRHHTNQLPKVVERSHEERAARRAASEEEAARKAEMERSLEQGRVHLGELTTQIQAGVSEDAVEGMLSLLRKCLEYLPASEVAPVMVNHAHLVATGSDYKALRRHMTRLGVEFAQPDPTSALTEEVSQYLESARSVAAGKSLALVGGQSRPEIAQQLEAALELGGLRWVESDRGTATREVQNLVKSVRTGGTDLVVVLTGFVGHKLDELERVCGLQEVPLRHANGSVGIRVILAAIAEMGQTQ